MVENEKDNIIKEKEKEKTPEKDILLVGVITARSLRMTQSSVGPLKVEKEKERKEKEKEQEK